MVIFYWNALHSAANLATTQWTLRTPSSCISGTDKTVVRQISNFTIRYSLHYNTEVVFLVVILSNRNGGIVSIKNRFFKIFFTEGVILYDDDLCK